MPKERNAIKATIIHKKSSDYFAIPGKVPQPTVFYELTFETEEGTKTFEVSQFEFNVVDCGDVETLVYEGNELISFGDKIKEFQMK